MSRPGGAANNRRYLGAELRRLRELVGISGRDMAARLEIGQSTVSRIEVGARLPRLPELTTWLEAVGANSEVTNRIVRLADVASTEVETYRTALQDAGRHLQGRAAEMESAARTVRTFEPIIVPGLLQTAEYARRAISLSPGTLDLPAALSARMDRQHILYENGRSFEFLITEAALRWPAGPTPVVRAQLDRIATLSTLESVRIGVLPLRHTPHAIGWHEFTIYETDDAAFVHAELAHLMLTVNDPVDIEQYVATYRSLSKSAMFDDAAVSFIHDVSESVRADDPT